MTGTQDLYRQYLRVLRRRGALLAIPTALCLVIGAIVLKTTPPTYRASTVVQVLAAKDPAGIPATSSEALQDSLKTVIPQLQSGDRLKMVVIQAGLKPGPGEDVNDLASRIARDLRVETMGRDSVESFQVFFSGSDPRTVRDVTNTLAHVFIEGNRMDQIRDVEGKVEFLQRDLSGKATELREKEEAISRLRQKNTSLLPDQYASNAARLSASTQEHGAVEQKLRSAREQLATLRGQALEAPAQAELEAEVRRLSELRATRTEQHPDVIASRERIRQLKALTAATPGGGTDGGDPSTKLDPKRRADLESAQWEVKQLEGQSRALAGTIRDLNQKLALAPRVQAEFEDLTRGYSALEDSYRTYKKKLEDAKTWLSLLRTSKGDGFAVVQPATLPVRPGSPDPLVVLPLALLVGLSLGIGCVLLVETLNESFGTPEELASATGAVVLGRIARITTLQDLKRKRKVRLLWAVVSVFVVLVVGWAVGP